MKNIGIKVLCVSLSFALLPLWVPNAPATPAAPASAAQLLAYAFAQLRSTHSWTSDGFVSSLQQIITKFPDSPEAVTAKTLLVPSLMQKGSSEDALSMCNSVITAQPNTWQSAFAMLNQTSILVSQGKPSEAMDSAKSAVTTIEAMDLQSVKDPSFDSFLQSTGLKRSDIEDGVLGLIASQKISAGDLTGAVEVVNKIHSPAILNQITQAGPDFPGATGTPARTTTGGTTPGAPTP